LAPYLYLLVADALGYMLQDSVHKIQGLKLPNGDTSLKMLFADDTSLSLLDTKENLDRTMKMLELYYQLSVRK